MQRGVPWTLKRVPGMLQVGPRDCREGTMEDLAEGQGGRYLPERVGVWAPVLRVCLKPMCQRVKLGLK